MIRFVLAGSALVMLGASPGWAAGLDRAGIVAMFCTEGGQGIARAIDCDAVALH